MKRIVSAVLALVVLAGLSLGQANAASKECRPTNFTTVKAKKDFTLVSYRHGRWNHRWHHRWNHRWYHGRPWRHGC